MHNPDNFAALTGTVRLYRSWGDCFGYHLLSCGRIDVMLDPVMSVWDCAALLPVLEEAGGKFTDWAGARTHTAPEAVSTNGALFERVRAAIAGGGDA